jgi:putative addiction module killer protein
VPVLELLRYQAADGRVPFSEWLGSIRDKQAQVKVRLRLRRLEAGLFGDCEPVGEGVLEMREHVGAGYRVYLGRHGRSIVILLCGGTKKTQPRDVKAAKEFWADWKRRQA